MKQRALHILAVLVIILSSTVPAFSTVQIPSSVLNAVITPDLWDKLKQSKPATALPKGYVPARHQYKPVNFDKNLQLLVKTMKLSNRAENALKTGMKEELERIQEVAKSMKIEKSLSFAIVLLLGTGNMVLFDEVLPNDAAPIMCNALDRLLGTNPKLDTLDNNTKELFVDYVSMSSVMVAGLYQSAKADKNKEKLKEAKEAMKQLITAVGLTETSLKEVLQPYK